MKMWITKATDLLIRTLEPIHQELNELDWKVDLSSKEERIHHHLSAFANYSGGGFLVFGIRKDGAIVGVDETSVSSIITKISNIARDGLEPAIKIDYATESFRGKALLFVYVEESIIKPVHVRGRTIEDAFIRSGGQTRKMGKEEIKKSILLSQNMRFEELPAFSSQSLSEILSRIEYISLFDMLETPVPRTNELIAEKLFSNRIITIDNGMYSITNLGAFICAKNIQSFSGKERKGVRVIKYDGNSRIKTEREQEGQRGYAVGFDGLIKYIKTLLPESEVIRDALRKTVTVYPEIAIREIVANALIHQDLTIPGMGPMIEIFSDRMEITNPGRLLPSIRVERLIDSAPESRNELLAKLMRLVKICEERGSGIDKALLAIEVFGSPPPEFIEGDNYFRVILYSPRPLNKMTRQERIRATYFHACLKHVNNERMTNSTLRERFKIVGRNYPIVSRIIIDTTNAGYIKKGDPNSSSRKHAYYIPFWA
jgi:ATP-dependent DNA helicase RecG